MRKKRAAQYRIELIAPGETERSWWTMRIEPAGGTWRVKLRRLHQHQVVYASMEVVLAAVVKEGWRQQIQRRLATRLEMKVPSFGG